MPVIWFYTAATGWEASAMRASVMMTVILGSHQGRNEVPGLCRPHRPWRLWWVTFSWGSRLRRATVGRSPQAVISRAFSPWDVSRAETYGIAIG